MHKLFIAELNTLIAEKYSAGYSFPAMHYDNIYNHLSIYDVLQLRTNQFLAKLLMLQKAFHPQHHVSKDYCTINMYKDS